MGAVGATVVGPRRSRRVRAHGMTILVDTREQLPWTFAGCRPIGCGAKTGIATPTARQALAGADYSILGMVGTVGVQRKSQADFYATLVHGRQRYEATMYRLAQIRHAFVVVEVELSAIILDAPRFTAAPPRSLIGSVLAWQWRWPIVQWVFAPGREAAELITYRILERAWREAQEWLRCRQRS